MKPTKTYNLLVILFPILYLIHNLEEWFALRTRVATIVQLIPDSIGAFLPNDSERLVSVFGVAVVFATAVPAIISSFLYSKFTPFNSRLLLIIAFATFINTVSHVTTSFVLGFISPGLITAVLLCLPYSIGIIVFTSTQFKLKFKNYLILGLISVFVYLLTVVSSWLMGMMIAG